jgi:hypothetical protein
MPHGSSVDGHESPRERERPPVVDALALEQSPPAITFFGPATTGVLIRCLVRKSEAPMRIDPSTDSLKFPSNQVTSIVPSGWNRSRRRSHSPRSRCIQPVIRSVI